MIRRTIGLIPAVLIQFLWLYVLYIITNRNESTYKTLWLLVILGLPVFGTILYFCFGNKRTGRPLRENGVMWDSMVEIMARKAVQGVDVRIIMPGVPDKALVLV